MQHLRAFAAKSWSGIAFLWRHMWGAHVPLAWHMAVVLIAAVGTYKLAPPINEALERQKLRGEYVKENLVELNNLLSELYVEIVDLKSADDATGRVEQLHNIDRTAAKLQWKSLELQAVLKEKRDRDLLRVFQIRLLELERAVARRDAPNGSVRLDRELLLFSDISVSVISGVAERASLRVDAPEADRAHSSK